MDEVALTIDDAPSSHMKKKVDILDKYEINAVFFCEGIKIKKRTEHIRYAIKNGHTIGNHSWSHKRFSSIDTETGEEEIRRTHKLIEEVYDSVGKKREHNFFRFPYGDKGNRGDSENKDFYQGLIEELGYTFPVLENHNARWSTDRDWYWTFNDKSYSLRSLEELLSRVKNNDFNSRRDVVIYHDHENTHSWFEPFIKTIADRQEFIRPSEI